MRERAEKTVRGTSARRAGVALLAALALLAPFAAPPASASEPAAEIARAAAEAYAEGRCAEVLEAFARLDAEGRQALDGVSHYRWGFCLAAGGRPGAEGHYRESARRLAERIEAGAAELDDHFYRVNAHLNLGEQAEAAEAARAATAAWQSGALVVPEDDPGAWFRLGKLFLDAGERGGALEPYARAIELAEKGADLRRAYIERIAVTARSAGATALASRADALVRASMPTPPQPAARAPRPPLTQGSAMREGRTLLADDQLDEARDAFMQARRERGPSRMAAQYAGETIERIEEVLAAGLVPADQTAEGLPLPVGGELRAELARTAREAWKVINEGRAIEVPRKSGKGTRPFPAEDVADELFRLQAVFTGLLREAIITEAPLREWAVADGYTPLIHHPWTRLFARRVNETRREQLVPQEQRPE